MGLVLAKLFMRQISQNHNENQTGVSLWTLEDIEKAQAKLKELELQAQEQGQQDGAGDALEFDGEYTGDYGDGGFSDNMLGEIDFDMQ